jgi:hypothetical protein
MGVGARASSMTTGSIAGAVGPFSRTRTSGSSGATRTPIFVSSLEGCRRRADGIRGWQRKPVHRGGHVGRARAVPAARGGRESRCRCPWGSWLARKDSNLRSPDPEDSQRFQRSLVRFERGADSDSVGPAGNQVEHAGRSQVNARRSSYSGIDRIAFDRHSEGEWFLQFPLLRSPDLRLSRVLAPSALVDE